MTLWAAIPRNWPMPERDELRKMSEMALGLAMQIQARKDNHRPGLPYTSGQSLIAEVKPGTITDKILKALAQGPMTARELAGETEGRLATVSSILTRLRRSGKVGYGDGKPGQRCVWYLEASE